MVFSGLRTRNTLRDLMVLMSRPLLFLSRGTKGVSIHHSDIASLSYVTFSENKTGAKLIFVLK